MRYEKKRKHTSQLMGFVDCFVTEETNQDWNLYRSIGRWTEISLSFYMIYRSVGRRDAHRVSCSIDSINATCK